MDSFINPPAALEAERVRLAAEDRAQERFPVRPDRDIMLFLLEHAPLRNWERDVLGMLREEAYYFAPQGRTKVMNEGWASYWHSKLMTERLLDPSEVVDYADHHSGTMATSPGRLNPYKLGIELWRDVEERWNRGRHGSEWEACDDYVARQKWDTGAMAGRDRIFEVRRHYNDVTFIDEFLTPDFVRRHGLFTYDYDPRQGQYVISDRDFRAVKEKLLFMLTNFGQPTIELAEANHLNRGELVLVHRFEGVPLKLDHARETLENVQQLWKRPVHLETWIDDTPVVLGYDGDEHSRDTRAVEV
jgi:stage V sporulation protein R